MADQVELRLQSLGITLPKASAPLATYVPYCTVGPEGGPSLLYISGQLPKGEEGLILGRLGETLSVEEGAKAARLCALNILAQAKAALPSLDHISRFVRLDGFVHSSPTFTEQAKVINGASDFLVEVFGKEKGLHTRVALGSVSLPLGVAVEISAVIEYKP